MPTAWKAGAQVLAMLAVALAVVAGIVAIYAAGDRYGRSQVQAAWDAERIEQLEAVSQAKDEQRERAVMERKRIETERQSYVQDLSRARGAAAAAGAELDRLRDAIAGLEPDGAAAACPAAGGLRLGPHPDAAPGGAGVSEAGALAARAADRRTPAQLLGECAAAHQELAAEADRLAIRLNRLLELVPR